MDKETSSIHLPQCNAMTLTFSEPQFHVTLCFRMVHFVAERTGMLQKKTGIEVKAL